MKGSVRFVWAAIVVASAFLAGYAVGGRNASATAGGPPDLQLTRVELLDALEPSPEQRVELEGIMETTRSRADSIMRELLGEIREVTTDAERRMRSILTSEQAARLDTLISRPQPARARQRRPPGA